MKKGKLNIKGFTLLEMLVVVLIIGILAGIALPQYELAVEKSKAAEAISLMGSLRQALDVYVLTHGYQGIELIGKMGEEGGELDIDVEAVLDCTLDDEGDRCFSKNFSYDAYCDEDDNSCSIRAYRYEGNNYNNDGKYSLAMDKTNSGWEKYCNNQGTDIGTKICKALEGQGWD